MKLPGVVTSTQVLEESSVLAAIENTLAMIEFNCQGVVLWANENFAKTMEYSVSEMPNLLHQQFCTTEFVNSKQYEEFWDHLRGGKSFQEKIQRVTKSGRLIWLEATYSPVYNEVGDVEAVIKIATDITDRENKTRVAIAKLQEMAEELRHRGEQGVTRSEEIASTTEKLVSESKDNLEVLESLKTQAMSIEDIVKTIRDIASQTNLLALNAAIEAARAGEHGRGFNIVAGEIRKLASRVQDSLEDVNSHIEGISGEINKISEVTQRSQSGIGNSQSLIQQAMKEFSQIGEAARQLDGQAKAFEEIL